MRTKSLFRPEVEGRNTARLGHVVVPSLSAARLGALVSLLTGSTLAAILNCGEYAPRQTVAGVVAPDRGLIKVTAPRAGKADFVRVQDGQHVEAGQTLALISVEQQYVNVQGQSTLERMLHDLDAEERRLNESIDVDSDTKKTGESQLNAKIAGLRRELEAERAGQAALGKQMTSVGATLQRLQKLRDAGYVTELELAARKEQRLELERQWQQTDKSIAGLENQIESLEFDAKQQPAQRKQSQAALLNQLSELKRQIMSYDASRGYAITAPIAGRVTALQLEPGKLVETTTPLLAIVADDTRLEAQLFVPSRAVGFLHAGQPVRLRYAAYPYQSYGTYGGRVSTISRTTLRPDELASGLPLTEPVYRVKAQLDTQTIHARGGEQPLQAGMLLEADILLERRPLWAWLFQPVLAFRGRL